MSVRSATAARVEAGHRYSAFYRGSFANHLPMALVALDQMGADDGTIARFAQRYEQANLEPLDADSDFALRARALARDIARHGSNAVLRQSVGQLASGVGSGAFHGAIRTAYALQTGSDEEMAHALAYWSAVFTPLEAGAVESTVGSPEEALAAVNAAVRGARPASRSITQCMAAAAADPRFASWCAPFAQPVDLGRIAPVLIGAYAGTRNFTLLHAVTGCHAVRLLLPFAPDPAALLRAFWVAVIAAYAGIGAPAGDVTATPATSAQWPEILRDAVRCKDEHDVKLVYSCWCEWQCHGGEIYRHVAAATAAAGAARVAEAAG